MKKYLKIIILLSVITIMLLPLKVNAGAGGSVDFSLDCGTPRTFSEGDTFSCELWVKNVNVIAKDFTPGIASLNGRVNFNNTALTVTAVTRHTLPDWNFGTVNLTTINNNGRFSYLAEDNDPDEDRAGSLRGDALFYTISFQVKAGAPTGALNINLSNSSATNNDFLGQELTVNVTNPTGFNIGVAIPKSNNTNLSALVMDGITFPDAGFDKNQKTYFINVPYSKSTTKILTATPEDTGASLIAPTPALNTDIPLSAGGTTNILIRVKAEDGTEDTYTVAITRALADTNNKLNTLNVLDIANSTDLLAGDFDPDVKNYTINVPYTTNQIDIQATINAPATITGPSDIGIKNLLVGTNTYRVYTLSESGVTNDYKIDIIRAGNNDATLSALSINNGCTLTPSFTSANDAYSCSVNPGTTSVTVTATKNDPNAKNIVTNGNTGLTVGPNIVTVTVTAEDNTTTKTYTITLTRPASTVSTLSTLTANGTGISGFTPGAPTSSYSFNVGKNDPSILIGFSKTDSNSTVEIKNITTGTSTPGTGSNIVALQSGVNTLEVIVTAEDGTTKTTYTITVNRNPSNVATLSNLEVLDNKSGGATLSLTPGFTSANGTYTINSPLAYTSDEVTINCTPDEDGTVVITSNRNASSGTCGATINLETGANVITVKVTAENNTNTKEYKITITRNNNDATLSALSINNGCTLTPGFTSANETYSCNVNPGTTSVTVTATKNDPNAKSVVISGDTGLIVGSNTITIVVTAEDNTTTKTYTVTLTRPASTISSLNTLAANGTGLAGFTSGAPTSSYNVNVGKNDSNILIGFTKTNSNSTVEIKNITTGTSTPGTGSNLITLQTGINTLEVIVTAEDGTTITTYTITVNRNLSAVASLSSLGVIDNKSGGTTLPLNPGFTQANGTYSITTPLIFTSDEITVTCATLEDGNVVITNNRNSANGTCGAIIGIETGVNIINVKVTAEDGINTKDYNITITRNKNNDASLNDLGVAGYTLTPGFTSANLGYNLTTNVIYALTNVTITYTPTDSKATAIIRNTTNSTTAVAGVVNLQVGTNVIDIEVTAEDGTTKKHYTINIVRDANSDATLSALSINNGCTLTPGFTSANEIYSCSVNPGTTSVTVNATKNDPNAKSVVINGNTGITAGLNIVTITVTAEDNISTKTYTVNLTRPASTISSLNTLTADGSTVPGFTSGASTSNYNVNVAFAASDILIGYTKTDNSSTVEIKNLTTGTSTSGTGSNTIALQSGTNTLEVIITAEDGITKTTYTITVNRNSASTANLSNLELIDNKNSGSLLTLNPSFSSAITVYTVPTTLTYTSDEVTVACTAADNGTVVITSDRNSDTGACGAVISLETGTNIITVKVTSEDGLNDKEYKVTINRTGNNDASLNSLNVIGYTITPTFNGGTLNYNLTTNVAHNLTDATINYIASDSNATVIIRNTTNSTTAVAGVVNLQVGTNVIDIEVTAEDGVTKKHYTIDIIRDANNDATLSALSINNGCTLTPGFTSANETYSCSVNPGTTSVTVTATKNDPNAKSVVISGDTALTIGSNTITTTVTAEDNTTTKTYTIMITRPGSTTSSLNTLTADGTTVPGFTSGAGTNSYSVSVASIAANILIGYTKTDTSSSVEIKNITTGTSTPGTGSNSIALQSGINTLEVIITAEDGITKTTYTITVNRDSSNIASLSNLEIINNKDSGNILVLNPGFISTQTSYNITSSLIYSNDLVTITCAASNNATVIITSNRNSDTGPCGSQINLATGSNIITIRVTAEDTITTKDYTVTITRAKNNDAGLLDLSVSGYTLTPIFSTTLTDYNLTSNVPNSVANVLINYTKSDSKAIVEILNLTTGLSDSGGSIALQTGTNEIEIKVIADNGTTTKKYKITIIKDDITAPELITSSVYRLEDSPYYIIATVADLTTELDFKNNLDNDNAKLFVYEKDGTTSFSGTYVATGMIVKLIDNGNVLDSRILVVVGDVNSDGEISVGDVLGIRAHILETNTLNDIYQLAADANQDSDISVGDILKVRLDILSSSPAEKIHPIP